MPIFGKVEENTQPDPKPSEHSEEHEMEKQCVTINIYCGGCGDKKKPDKIKKD